MLAQTNPIVCADDRIKKLPRRRLQEGHDVKAWPPIRYNFHLEDLNTESLTTNTSKEENDVQLRRRC
jgi:hypothetical protein